MLMASSSLSNYSLLLFSSRSPSIPISSSSSSKFPIRLLSPSPMILHSRRQLPVVKEKSTAALRFSGSMENKGLNGCSIHLLQRNSWFGSIPRRCNKGWGSEGEGDFALETEILKFMDCSENPNKFPTKKDLINAGRGDLVEAIEKIRDWLSKGWDLDKEGEEIVQENEAVDLSSGEVEEDLGSGFLHSDDRMLQERCFNGGESDSLEEVDVGIIASEDSSSTPSSSGREMEKEEEEEEEEEDDAGINGILKRLEKKRNGSRNKETDIGDDLSCKNGSMSAEIGLDEATDNIVVQKNANETEEEKSSYVQTGQNWFRSHVQHLELELASTLQSLKSASEIDNSSLKGPDSPSDEFLELSDAWEFQETEVMNAKNKLRSIRAKLAILEGKIALAAIESQKNLEMKQKRINVAQLALNTLRTACIVWPNSKALVVLVCESFHGWTSQTVMEKSNSGFFILNLKLYPGRYEFKFIVDGVWKIDVGIIASEDSSSTPSSSGREMEKEEEEEEEERNLSFGFDSREKETDIGDDLSCKNGYEDDWKLGSSMAAEIGLDEATDNIVVQKNGNETEEERSPYVQPGQNWFRSQHLELELASTLQSLKSASEIDLSPLKGSNSSSSDEFRNSCDSEADQWGKDTWKPLAIILKKIWECIKKSHSEAVKSLENYIDSFRKLWVSYVEANRREYEQQVKLVFPNFNPPDHPRRRSRVFMTTLEERFYDFVFKHARWFVKTITAPLWQFILLAVWVLGGPIGLVRLAIFGIGAIVNALSGNALSEVFVILRNVSMRWFSKDKRTEHFYPKPPKQPRPKEFKQEEFVVDSSEADTFRKEQKSDE